MVITEGEQTLSEYLTLAHGLLTSYVTWIQPSLDMFASQTVLSTCREGTSAYVLSIPTFPDEGNKRSCCVRYFW